MIKLEHIKGFVDEYFDKDVSKRTRFGGRPMMRYVYYKLARENTPFVFADIGKEVNRNHATVIHGIKKFQDEYNQKHFLPFKNAYLHISELIKEENLKVKKNIILEIYELPKNEVKEFEQMAKQFLEMKQNNVKTL